MMDQPRLGSSLPSLQEILEALLFATDEPLPLKHAVEIIEGLEDVARPRTVNEEALLQCIEELNRNYEASGRVYRIVKIAGGYQFATLPRFSPWLGRMVRERAKRKLSQAALESLAVIAYKQPVTKPELEAIRGVNADYVIHSLLEKTLITIVGRAATPGRPLLYGTTKEFLKHFGLNDLSELPKPREIDELMAEAEFEVEKRMLADLEAKQQAQAPEEEVGRRIVVSEEGKLQELDDPRPEGTGPEDQDPQP
jgi:segregation and condensation protein B